MTTQSANAALPSVGKVYLVGAGPGDPGLLTLRGADLLASADLVVYDALANPRLLAHCPEAEKIYVGKKAAAHSMTQEQINLLLIDHAKAGKQVVRLKGGDPFVFGRGGEECEALAGAKVPFEVVPGITAAIAVPAYAGIPVTHRDFNSSFTFLTGHEKEEEYREVEANGRSPGAGSDVDWPSVAKLPCIAFYMGVKSLPRICSKLIEHGLHPDTPAATIQSGTTPVQRTIVATVKELPAKVAEAKIAPPALTIIGQVVSLRSTMNWFETRPLFGQTIIVTRARDQASELVMQLETLGARVLEAPAIELVPASNRAVVDSALSKMSQHPFDWIVFTSANGVGFTKRRLFDLDLDSRIFGPAKLAAIGEATADAIRDQLGLKVDLCPTRFFAEALADELLSKHAVKGKRFLLLRADIARPLLREQLHKAGAEVLDLPIYETKSIESLPPEISAALNRGEVNWITFTSSSTVNNFLTLLGPDFRTAIGRAKLASIGPITSSTLIAQGLQPTVEATQFTISGLVDAITMAY